MGIPFFPISSSFPPLGGLSKPMVSAEDTEGRHAHGEAFGIRKKHGTGFHEGNADDGFDFAFGGVHLVTCSLDLDDAFGVGEVGCARDYDLRLRPAHQLLQCFPSAPYQPSYRLARDYEVKSQMVGSNGVSLLVLGLAQNTNLIDDVFNQLLCCLIAIGWPVHKYIPHSCVLHLLFCHLYFRPTLLLQLPYRLPSLPYYQPHTFVRYGNDVGAFAGGSVGGEERLVDLRLRRAYSSVYGAVHLLRLLQLLRPDFASRGLVGVDDIADDFLRVVDVVLGFAYDLPVSAELLARAAPLRSRSALVYLSAFLCGWLFRGTCLV